MIKNFIFLTSTKVGFVPILIALLLLLLLVVFVVVEAAADAAVAFALVVLLILACSFLLREEAPEFMLFEKDVAKYDGCSPAALSLVSVVTTQAYLCHLLTVQVADELFLFEDKKAQLGLW